MIDPALLSLADRVIRGEADAEMQFVARIRPAVRNIVRSAVRADDWAAIDDVCQEVLWQIILRLRRGGLADMSRLDHFMCRMARNVAVDLWRVRAREQMEVNESVQGPNPFDEIEREDALRAARVMIASLRSERDRTLLLGVYFHNQSKESLCQRFGIDADHFDRVLHRARTRLLVLLQSPGRAGGEP